MLSIVVIVFLLLIGYWHFMQGLLGGFISAVAAICAGAVAFSYYEPLSATLSGGKFNDSADGVCLMVLFAASYMVLRVLADTFVGGNIRINSTFDKIGGAIFGLVAGVIGLGVVVLGVQSMPMGPSVGGYARFSVAPDPRPVQVALPEGVPNAGRQVDRMVNDELKAERLETGEQSGLMIPVDDWVVALYSHLSDAGSLAGDRPLKSVHPNLPQEYFAQRIGLETNAHHTVSNKKTQQAKLGDLYVLDDKMLKARAPAGLVQVQSEIKRIRPPEEAKAVLPPLALDGEKVMVIVGVLFSHDAADEKDGERFARMGASGIRLVAQDGGGEWRNYFPVGTLEDGKVWATKPDDFLFMNVSQADAGARFVFVVDKAAVNIGVAPQGGKATVTFAPGAFVEVKRGAKFELSEAEAKAGLPADNRSYWPVRKFELKKPSAAPAPGDPTPPVAVTPTPDPTPTPPTPTPPTPTPPTPTADNGWNDARLTRPMLGAGGGALPVPINVADAGADVEVLTAWATGSVKGRKFTMLDVTPTVPESAPAELAKGSPVVELAPAAGSRVVQVRLTPKSPADWSWADNLGDFTVVDQENKVYKPRGAITVAALPANAKRVTAQYDAEKDLPTLHKVDGGGAGEVTLYFVIPTGSKAVEIRYQGKEGGVKLEL